MSEKIRNISSRDEFDALVRQTDKPVVIDFWAPWCGPCQALGPILEQTAGKLGDDAIVAKVNIDEHRSLASENQITSIPAIFYYAGGQLQHRETGITPSDKILARVNDLTAVV